MFVNALEGTLVLRKPLDYETLANFSVDIRAQVSNDSLNVNINSPKTLLMRFNVFFLFFTHRTRAIRPNHRLQPSMLMLSTRMTKILPSKMTNTKFSSLEILKR